MTQFLDKSTGVYHGPLDSAGIAVVGGTGGIAAGNFVYIDSYSSGVPVVKKAQANSAATSNDVYFAPSAISAGESGYVFTTATWQTDTSGASAADAPVYLSDSEAGGWTTTKPTATDIVKVLGSVIVKSATVGYINVNTGDESIIAHDHSDAANGGDLAATGGTIDGVTIGAATPAAVTGTDFTGNTVTISGSATIEHPIDMNSVAAMTGNSTTDNGNVIKISRSAGDIGGTHSGIICKHYITGGDVDGTGLVSGLYVNLKYEPDSENAAAEVSLMQTHLYSDASDAIDYGWYCLAPDSKISALLGVSGNMASFMEVKASGNGGFTVSSDGMTKNPESDTEDAYLTITVEGGASYQIPAYTA